MNAIATFSGVLPITLAAITGGVLVAWAAAAIVGTARVALRHAIWSWALIGVVLSPIAILIAPRIPVDLQRTAQPDPGSGSTTAQVDAKPLADVSSRESFASSETTGARIRSSVKTFAQPGPAPVSKVPSLSYFFAAVWGFGVVLGLVRFVYGHRSLRRIRKSARELFDGDPLFRLSQQVAAEMGMARPPRMFLASQSSTPFAIGLWSRSVFVTSACRRLPPSEMRTILVHEFAHLRHGHAWFRAAQSFATLVYWFHPLVHLLNRELTQVQEDLCDNAVLQQTPPGDYSRLLLAFARRSSGLSVAGALTFSPKTRIERRIERLIDTRRDMSIRCSRRLRVLVPASVLIAFAVVAMPLKSIASSSKTFADESLRAPDAVGARLLSDDLPASVESYVSFESVEHLRNKCRTAVGPMSRFEEWATHEVETYLGISEQEFRDRVGVEVREILRRASGQVLFAIDAANGGNPLVLVGQANTELVAWLNSRAALGNNVSQAMIDQRLWLTVANGVSGSSLAKPASRLRDNKAHASITSRCRGSVRGDLHWFVSTDATLQRYRRGEQARRRGTDLVELVHSQDGFREISALGGMVEYPAAGPISARHHSLIYRDGSGQQSVGLLAFGNTSEMIIPAWVTEQLQSVSFVSFDLLQSLPALGRFVDAYAGDEVFQDVLRSIRLDPAGPQVDPLEVIGTLDDWVVTATLPDDDASLVLFGCRDTARLEVLTEKLFKADPSLRKVSVGNAVVWESTDGSTSAAVYGGCLLVCSSSTGLRSVVEKAEDQASARLVQNGLFSKLSHHLDEQLAGPRSIRCFSRDGNGLLPPFRTVPSGNASQSIWEHGLRYVAPAGQHDLASGSTRSRLPTPSALSVLTADDGWEVRGVVLRGR